MNFLLDENFPKSAGDLLRDLGHNVYDFRLLSEEGASDFRVMELAIIKSALVLGTDRDFFHTIGRQYTLNILAYWLSHLRNPAEKLL